MLASKQLRHAAWLATYPHLRELAVAVREHQFARLAKSSPGQRRALMNRRDAWQQACTTLVAIAYGVEADITALSPNSDAAHAFQALYAGLGPQYAEDTLLKAGMPGAPDEITTWTPYARALFDVLYTRVFEIEADQKTFTVTRAAEPLLLDEARQALIEIIGSLSPAVPLIADKLARVLRTHENLVLELDELARSWEGQAKFTCADSEVCHAYGALHECTADVRKLLIASGAADMRRAPSGSWLWQRLVDWCHEEGVEPVSFASLFTIAGEAFKRNLHETNPAIKRQPAPDVLTRQSILIQSLIEIATNRAVRRLAEDQAAVRYWEQQLNETVDALKAEFAAYEPVSVVLDTSAGGTSENAPMPLFVEIEDVEGKATHVPMDERPDGLVAIRLHRRREN